MDKFLCSSKASEMKNGQIPEWGMALEPVRTLPTNVGSRIRSCIIQALQKHPPEWAKKRLEHSISQEVYSRKASGPTKREVVSVLRDLEEETEQENLKKKRKMMNLSEEDCTIVSNVTDLDLAETMKMETKYTPEWARALEPVRKLPTNVGSRVKSCVNQALEKDPPEWAKKRLKHSISKEVYDRNASGPTKRAVVAVLTDLEEKIVRVKLKKKKEPDCIVNSVTDSDLETVSLQCGDKGVDAYVYCVKCVKFALHRHCLPKMPKTSDEIVRWVCDDCQPVSSGSAPKEVQGYTQDGRSTESVISTSTSGPNKKSISQSLPEEDEKYCLTESLLQSKHENLGSIGDSGLADEPNANNYWSQKENVPMKHEHLDGVDEVKVAAHHESLQTTNLRKKTEVSSSLSRKQKEILPANSARKRVYGEHQSDISCRHSGQEVREKVANESLQRTRVRKETETFSWLAVKENQRLPTTLNQKRVYAEPESDTSHLVIQKPSNGNEEILLKPQEDRKPMHNTLHETFKECEKEESQFIPIKGNEYEEVSRDPVIPPSSIQGQPVLDPIWRGRFNIVNKNDDKFEVFVAHLSSRACQQVLEEARLLPALLQLEMVPKSTVWPKSFQTIQPNADDIALYIFPADKRYEEVFDRLVVYITVQELAMRAITESGELLIFSSTDLPMQYWRFQNKYFIWGIFKAKSSRSSDIQENRVNTKLCNMQHATCNMQHATCNRDLFILKHYIFASY